MPNLPTYKRRVASAVSPLVNETPATGIAQGVGQLATGVTEAAGQIENLVQNAVYGQEIDQAKIDFSKMREQHIADMRENPLIANRDENGRIIDPEFGFGHMNEMRTKAWEDNVEQFMTAQRERFSHGRAEQDFATWSAQQKETTRAEINQQTITEQLEFIGAMRTQDIQDAVADGNFGLAREITANGVADGAFSIGVGEEMSNVIDEEEEYQGVKSAIFDGFEDTESGASFPGYNSFDDPLTGLAEAYDQIESMNLSDKIEDRLMTELDAHFTKNDEIDRKFKARAEEESWNDYTTTIETEDWLYGPLKQEIADDETLSARTKEHLWARMDSMMGGEEAGTLAQRMEVPAAVNVYNDRYLTNEQAYDKLLGLKMNGEINPDVFTHWAQKVQSSRDEGTIMHPPVFDGYEAIVGVYDARIKTATGNEDWEEVADLQIRKTAARDYYQEQAAVLGPEASPEEYATAARNAIMFGGGEKDFQPRDAGPYRPQLGVVDFANFSELERVIYLGQNGALEGIEGYPSSVEALNYATSQSYEKLSSEYNYKLQDFELVGEDSMDFHINAYNPATRQTRSYKFQTHPNSKKRLQLMTYEDGGWIPATIQSNGDIDANSAAAEVEERNLAAARGEIQTPEERLRENFGEYKFYNGLPEIWLLFGNAEVERRLSENEVRSITSDQIFDAKARLVAEGFDVDDISHRRFSNRLKRALRGVGIPAEHQRLSELMRLAQKYIMAPPED